MTPPAPSVLAIGLTPGDVELGCGGTLALLADVGYRVEILSCRRGDDEATAVTAAQTLGASRSPTLSLPNGPDHFGPEDVASLASHLRHSRPEMIFTFASGNSAPDQLALSCLTVAAVQAAADGAAQEVAGEPWTVSTTFGFELRPPLASYGQTVNITASLPRKLQAIRAYPELVDQGYDAAMAGLARYRGALSREGDYVEVFEVLAGEYDVLRNWYD